MKLFFDTSAVFAALTQGHEFHERAFPWYLKVQRGEHSGFIAAHGLAELYSALTRIPKPRTLSPSGALALLQREILSTFQVVPLDEKDYLGALASACAAGRAGGAIFDALIVEAALKVEPDHLITFNSRHFQGLSALLEEKLLVP